MSDIGHTPVFPIKDMNDHLGPTGLTVRDYMAIHSGVTLADVVRFSEESGRTITGKESVEILAVMRFAAADAMLEARK